MPTEHSHFSHPLISAWAGEGNYGDELMALGLRTLLREDFGVKQVCYYQSGSFGISPDPAMRVSCLRHSPVALRERFAEPFTVPRHDLLLYGGGSIFHSENSIRWKHALLRRYRLFKKEKPAGAVGVSVGPFPTAEAEKSCAAFFNALDFIVCRDSESAHMAAAMTSPDKVSLCGDLALLVPEFFKQAMPPAGQRNPDLVGLFFIKRNSDSEAFSKHGHAGIFQKIVDSVTDTGKRVRLFTLYDSPDMDDASLNASLKANAARPDLVDLHTFTGDVFETVRQCNECSAVLSMRLHGVITAHILGVPCASIAYNPKSHFFMNMLKSPAELSLSWDSPTLTQDALAALAMLTCMERPAAGGGILEPAIVRKTLRSAIAGTSL